MKVYTAVIDSTLKIFLIYKEIQMGSGVKSSMRIEEGGFLIYEEKRKYFTIYEEAVSPI